jgi:hypothetical protein
MITCLALKGFLKFKIFTLFKISFFQFKNRFFGVVAYSAKKMPVVKVFLNAEAYSAKDFLALSSTALNIFWRCSLQR